jgi:hypothetical protein
MIECKKIIVRTLFDFKSLLKVISLCFVFFSLQPSMMIPTAGHGSLIHPHAIPASHIPDISHAYPQKVAITIPKKSPLPSGYLLHSHGKIHHF